MRSPERLEILRAANAYEPRAHQRLEGRRVRGAMRLRPGNRSGRGKPVADATRRLDCPGPPRAAGERSVRVGTKPPAPHGGRTHQAPRRAHLHRLDRRAPEHRQIRDARKHRDGTRTPSLGMVVHRPHAPTRAGKPARGSPANPDTVATAGGERETLAGRPIDEREDDARLARAGVCVVEQPPPRAGDALGRAGAMQAPGEGRDFACGVHIAELYSRAGGEGNLPGRVPPTGRLIMDPTTLSPARLDLWRALDQFEDRVRARRAVMFLGRGPSPWRDDAIRAAARAVAGEETLGEEDVIRGLLADAYGFGDDPRRREFSPYEDVARIAGALRRQSEPLGPAALSQRAVATEQAEKGDIGRALTTAQHIRNAYMRGVALRDIAHRQAETGDIEGALTTVRSIDDAARRAETLGVIANTQAKAGDTEGALTTVRSIDDAARRAEVLGAIAETQAEAGDIDGALENARSIEDVSQRGWALKCIAAKQADQGKVEGALTSAQSIPTVYPRGLALSIIAVAQASAGAIDGALETSRSIEDADDRAYALSAIAVAQANAGDVDAAQATARSIEDAYQGACALSAIAAAQANAGDVNAAQATARSIEDAHERAWALGVIAEEQNKGADQA